MSRPHTAILSIELEVHSLLDSGECSGNVLTKEALNEHGISSAYLIPITGHTMEACLKKLKSKLEMLNEHDE